MIEILIIPTPPDTDGIPEAPVHAPRSLPVLELDALLWRLGYAQTLPGGAHRRGAGGTRARAADPRARRVARGQSRGGRGATAPAATDAAAVRGGTGGA